MKRPPDFSELRKALLLEGIPSYVPMAELYISPKVKEAILGEKVDSVEKDVVFWQRAGYDYILINYPTILLFRQDIPDSLRYDLYKMTTLEMPSQWDESRGKITNHEEFETFNWPEPERLDCSMLKKIEEYLPEGMRVISGTSGIYEQIWMLMGFQTFCEKLYQDPELVAKIFNKIGDIVFRVFEKLSNYDSVGAMWVGDDVGCSQGLTIQPEILRTHTFPWFRRMKQVCRKRNLPFIYHSDGDISEILDDLLDIGVNALHPIEPKAMDILDLKKKFGKRLCLIGNVDLDLLTRGTPKEVEAAVKQKIQTLAQDGGYVLGSSNSIAQFVDPKNYLAMIRARELCGYS